MSTQNLDIIKGLYEAFGRGDIPALLAGLTPDCSWTEAEGFPYGGTYVGPNAVLEGVFMRVGAEWETFSAVPDEFVASGDTVVAIGLYSGRYKTTGKSFKAPFVHVWKLRDGKVIKFNQHTDTLVVHRALQS